MLNLVDVSIFVSLFFILHFLYFDLLVLYLTLVFGFAEMELGLKRALAVKKATNLQTKAGSLSTSLLRQAIRGRIKLTGDIWRRRSSASLLLQT